MILEKVKKTINKYNLLKKGDRVLIGVSGGPDSVTLLYLLKAFENEMGITLYIAHLDHRLRKESSKDAAYVQELAKNLRIKAFISKADVRSSVKKGSLEEIARNIRFKFFFKIAKKMKISKIALAHNLDDQAETVLMRILRGTGLYGLMGILPKRMISGYEIIRPLIEVKRKEIEVYISKKKIKPRTDHTNSEDIYFRNKIRNKLLPLLERDYSNNIKGLLSNLANSVAYDYDYLDITARRIFARTGKNINLLKFLKLPRSIQRMVLRLGIAKLKGDTRRITFQHIKEIEDLLLNRPVNSIVDLPKGIVVIKKQGCFNIFLKKKH